MSNKTWFDNSKKEYDRQEMKDFNNAFTYPFGLLIIVSILILLYLNQSDKKQCKIKPCNCLAYSQFVFAYEKYNLYVDSLQVVKKKNSERYTDSLVKYSRILKQND